MHIGVRELKRYLSKYLGRVDEGWITPPKRTDGLGAPVRQRSSKRIADVLLEDRGE